MVTALMDVTFAGSEGDGLIEAGVVWLSNVGAYGVFRPVRVEVNGARWVKEVSVEGELRAVFAASKGFLSSRRPAERLRVLFLTRCVGECALEKVRKGYQDVSVLGDEAMDGVGEAEEGSEFRPSGWSFEIGNGLNARGQNGEPVDRDVEAEVVELSGREGARVEPAVELVVLKALKDEAEVAVAEARLCGREDDQSYFRIRLPQELFQLTS
ncbi:hypothetical protein HDU97_009264 [Phlyctochytrium planicorne]|nr:hypothetical protein HDU97_009264 [Phlyctochytrium planicorne]